MERRPPCAGVVPSSGAYDRKAWETPKRCSGPATRPWTTAVTPAQPSTVHAVNRKSPRAPHAQAKVAFTTAVEKNQKTCASVMEIAGLPWAHGLLLLCVGVLPANSMETVMAEQNRSSEGKDKKEKSSSQESAQKKDNDRNQGSQEKKSDKSSSGSSGGKSDKSR